MILYEDLSPSLLITTKLKDKLFEIVKKSELLRNLVDTENSKVKVTITNDPEGDDGGESCQVAFTMQRRERLHQHCIAKVHFSGMPGLCSTVIAHDVTAPYNVTAVHNFIVEFLDNVIAESKYSCVLYTVTEKQEQLRSALIRRGFKRDKEVTHKNLRSRNTILFYHKHYNQNRGY